MLRRSTLTVRCKCSLKPAHCTENTLTCVCAAIGDGIGLSYVGRLHFPAASQAVFRGEQPPCPQLDIADSCCASSTKSVLFRKTSEASQ